MLAFANAGPAGASSSTPRAVSNLFYFLLALVRFRISQFQVRCPQLQASFSSNHAPVSVSMLPERRDTVLEGLPRCIHGVGETPARSRGCVRQLWQEQYKLGMVYMQCSVPEGRYAVRCTVHHNAPSAKAPQTMQENEVAQCCCII